MSNRPVHWSGASAPDPTPRIDCCLVYVDTRDTEYRVEALREIEELLKWLNAGHSLTQIGRLSAGPI